MGIKTAVEYDAYDHDGNIVKSFVGYKDGVMWLMSVAPDRYANWASAYATISGQVRGGSKNVRNKYLRRRPPTAPYRFAPKGDVLAPIVVTPLAGYAYRRYETLLAEAKSLGLTHWHDLRGQYRGEVETVKELRKMVGGRHVILTNKEPNMWVFSSLGALRKEINTEAPGMRRHGAHRIRGYDLEIVEPGTGVVLATVHGVVAAEKIFGWQRSKISECANGLKEMYNGYVIRKKEGSDDSEGEISS